MFTNFCFTSSFYKFRVFPYGALVVHSCLRVRWVNKDSHAGEWVGRWCVCKASLQVRSDHENSGIIRVLGNINTLSCSRSPCFFSLCFLYLNGHFSFASFWTVLDFGGVFYPFFSAVQQTTDGPNRPSRFWVEFCKVWVQSGNNVIINPLTPPIDNLCLVNGLEKWQSSLMRNVLVVSMLESSLILFQIEPFSTILSYLARLSKPSVSYFQTILLSEE